MKSGDLFVPEGDFNHMENRWGTIVKAALLAFLMSSAAGGMLYVTAAECVRRGSGVLIEEVILISAAGFVVSLILILILFTRRDSYIEKVTDLLRKISQGYVDVEAPAPGKSEHRDMSSALNSLIEALKERDRMKHSLGRIMDPKIAEVLIKEDPKVGGLRRQATILFCDIRNYTSLCEEMSVEELQKFLNEYWRDTVDIIMQEEGTIDKFHGDGVCVIFGAPYLHEDDSLRAVRAAWNLIKNVDAFNVRRQLERKSPIQIGIGIHMGEVIAGHIGSERRMDYTVMGDVVNVAARMEELNKKFGTRILISDTVYEKVESHVRVKTLTLAHLRGHKRPILIHNMVDFSDSNIKSDSRDNRDAA